MHCMKNFLIDIIYWELLVQKVSEKDAMLLPNERRKVTSQNVFQTPTDSTISSLLRIFSIFRLNELEAWTVWFLFLLPITTFEMNYLTFEYLDKFRRKNANAKTNGFEANLCSLRIFWWEGSWHVEWNGYFQSNFLVSSNRSMPMYLVAERYNNEQFQLFLNRFLVYRFISAEIFAVHLQHHRKLFRYRERSNERKERCIVIVSPFNLCITTKCEGLFILTLLAGIFMILLEIAHLNKWIVENQTSYI